MNNMVEFTTYTEAEYESDVEIDFSKLTKEEKIKLISSINKGKTYKFKKVPLFFCGEVEVEYEPESWWV